MITSGQSKRIEENLKGEERVINKYLGMKRLRIEGKAIRDNYLTLMRKYYEINYELDNEDTDQKRYFDSKSTTAKRIILDEIGGELLSVRENGLEQDQGIRFDELGELERKLDTPELPVSATLSKEKHPCNALPVVIEVSEHKRGYKLKVDYVESHTYGEGKSYKTQDSFDFFPKTLLDKNILFVRFNTPVGESLTHYGGTWALGLSYTTYELDRYGGLIAIQELNGDDDPKEIAKSKIDRIFQRIKNYLTTERERSIRYLQGLKAYQEAKQLLGENYSDELRWINGKLSELK